MNKSKKNTNIKTNTNISNISNIVSEIQEIPLIPSISKSITKKNKKDVNLENIEKYIYSNKFTHIYLYNNIDNNSIKEVRLAIDNANKSDDINNVKVSPKGIILHINSPGGAITSGIALMRIVARSRVPIITYIEGISASAATFICILSKYRVIAPHASILIHQYSSLSMGQRDELQFNMKISEKMYSMMTMLYRKHTNIPTKYLNELLEHDLLLTPELALKYGLVDKILMPQNSLNIEKYFNINPEYDLSKIIFNKKTNFNNIYLYGESYWMENTFTKSLEIVVKLVDIIQKHKIYNNNKTKKNNINSIISKGGSKPIIFHISDLGEFNNIYHILPIINILSMCPIPTISIIDGPMSEIPMLLSLFCHKTFIYHYAFITINFVNINEGGMKLGDVLYNTKMFIKLIYKILKTYTKLPSEIINNIFKKRYIFSAKQSVKYGLVNSILYD